jgi:hypothetical protein
MVRAIAARIQGDDYQARWFWIQACRLFTPLTKVVKVAYEFHGVKSFDDVVVYYEGRMDDEGNSLLAEYYQVKFHVTSAGAFTWQGMMDPGFINASSISILQRLKNAQQQFAPYGMEAHFILYSPWQIHPDDPLAQIHSVADGRLDWERLARGGNRSKMGKIRTAWREYLKLDSDEELRIVLRPLRILPGKTLIELNEKLNDKLYQAGLKPVEEGQLIHPYDDLARRLIQSGKTEFIRSDIEAICKRENLWMEPPISRPNAYQVGIRSFLRWAENLEDETDVMLDLLRWFDGRNIKSPELWQEQIYPAVQNFLATLSPNQTCHLHLHAHLSIAFAAGYCLNSKSGIDVAVVQSTRSGRIIWHPNANPNQDAYPTWIFTEELLAEGGSDIAIAIAITHDISTDVKFYLAQTQLPIRRIISATLPGRPNPQAILDGDHAKLLADQLSNYLRVNRTLTERQSQLHIFAAAPNGLVFFIGQVARSFGTTAFYEYDFDTNMPGAYQPSLAFPPLS